MNKKINLEMLNCINKFLNYSINLINKYKLNIRTYNANGIVTFDINYAFITELTNLLRIK